jgi:diacylglycerol kinase family enzyme
MARRITFKKLRIEADSPYWIQTDGELRSCTQQTDIQVRSRVLRMLMPPRAMNLLKSVARKDVDERAPAFQ